MAAVSVRDAVDDELETLRVVDEAPGLVAVALALAAQLDFASGGTAAANVGRELRMVMADLRDLAPVRNMNDSVDEITKRREARRRVG